jgi:predicted DNA-binding protein (MmcQ/YjbR family)
VDGDVVQRIADRRAMRLPGADLERRVNPDWTIYKVRGKVFMLMTDMPGHPVVILKADPDDAVALREEHADITPGYHMNKIHWITVHGGESIDGKLVENLVTDSYRLVIAGLPAASRPVDQHQYDHGA